MKNKVVIILYFVLLSCKAQEIDVFKITKQENPPIEEVQKAVEYNLDNTRIYESEKYRIPLHIKFDYFSEKARNRLVELFENKWTEKEIESEIKASLNYILDTINPRNNFYRRVKKIAKKDSLPVKKIWDSLLLKRKNEYRVKIIKNKISNHHVINASYTKDKRFIPYIQELLKDKDYFEKDILKLALARYEIEPYHSEVIKENSFEKFIKIDEPYDLLGNYRKAAENLVFINSKKSIDELIKFINIEGKAYNYSSDVFADYVAAFVISNLSIILKNRELDKELPELDDMGFNLDSLNKGRQLINKYFTNYSIDDIDSEIIFTNLQW